MLEGLEYNFRQPKTYGWIEIKLNDYLINHVWDCVGDARGNHKSKLVGHIDKSLAIEDKNNILFDQLLLPLVNAYGNNWGHGHFNVPIYKKDRPTGGKAWGLTSYSPNNAEFFLDQFWVNYQNKHEFNPIHNHGGVYSFACWLKIPTDYKDQNEIYNAIDANGSFNSAFCFHYTDSLGNIRTTLYEQYPDLEGTMLFFPAALNHEVYPFYNCDEQRISISGNIWLKEK